MARVSGHVSCVPAVCSVSHKCGALSLFQTFHTLKALSVVNSELTSDFNSDKRVGEHGSVTGGSVGAGYSTSLTKS